MKKKNKIVMKEYKPILTNKNSTLNISNIESKDIITNNNIELNKNDENIKSNQLSLKSKNNADNECSFSELEFQTNSMLSEEQEDSFISASNFAST